MSSTDGAGSTVLTQREGNGVTWLVMNRPAKRNAMDPAMHWAMLAALDELEVDDEPAVVVLTGSGRAFSAGQDLRVFVTDLEERPAERAAARRLSRQWRFDRLTTFPKPTIAMVNGWCCGAALAQVLACDVALAAEEARFALPEVHLGLLPGGEVLHLLAASALRRDALYYVMTGEPFDGRQAAALRLVNRAVPLAHLRRETLAMADTLMARNPAALRAVKEAFRFVPSMDREQAVDYLEAKNAQLLTRCGPGHRDSAIAAFLEQKAFRPALGPRPR